MQIKKRNLLCIKDKNNLDLGHRLIYEPYKNIVVKFLDLSSDISAKEFDPVSRIFDGLESIPENLKYYYESLLGITSYYQHSQGGKGKYIEKKLASSFKNCSLNIKISELPLWFQYPELHRKKGIFTLNGLTRKEKETIRKIEWDYLGNDDETTDLGSLLKNKRTIELVEIKNRVDSGGTAARREIWTQKFDKLLNFMSNTKPLYRKHNINFAFNDFIKHFGFEKVEIYIGIIYNVDGSPATREGDRQKGFYSANIEGYNDLKKFILDRNIPIISENPDILEFQIKLNDITVKFGPIYGSEIPYKLFGKKYSISDLLILKYDDIWFSQLLAINERMFLLKFNNNYLRIFRKIILQDEKARKLYNNFIVSEGSKKTLENLMQYLLKNYSKKFTRKYCPIDKNREEYLADVIQFLASAES